MKTISIALIALAFAASGAAAQHKDHQPPTKSDRSASTRAFQAANAKMHKDMAIRFSGNADADFVKGMIAHHQGAIDMAKVVIAHGKDAEVKKLAEDIIKAQQGEIAWMTEWLKKQPK